MKAMILAAGLGTRLKPFTNMHPKALAVVNGKTLLQRNIEYLAAQGIRDVIINVHHFADQIIDVLKKNDGFGSKITISDESAEVLETGGGLKKASWYFRNDKSPFVLVNVDILTDMKMDAMLEKHISLKALATLAVSARKTTRYFLFNEKNVLCGWKNTHTGLEKLNRKSDKYYEKAFWGIHIISPEIFNLINREGKFSVVDAYMDLCKTHIIFGFEDNGSRFIDVGKPESIKQAEEMFL